MRLIGFYVALDVSSKCRSAVRTIAPAVGHQWSSWRIAVSGDRVIKTRSKYIFSGNVDWALLNFMQDWFPKEAKAKLKQNEREAAQEELQELGIADYKCTIQ